jgi:hypothetical protein
MMTVYVTALYAHLSISVHMDVGLTRRLLCALFLGVGICSVT